MKIITLPRLLKIFTMTILVSGVTGHPALLAQEQGEQPKPPKLFESEEPLAITLSAPWREIVRNEDYQGTYPATLEYRDASGNPVQLALTVERRGVKRQEACDFPPIKWRFEKDAVKGTMFRGQGSIKMVTHCERSSKFEQYYRLEMLSYRIYNLLTDYSFRVRPLKVDYVDSKEDKVDDGRFAFIIEDDSDVAKRNGLKKLEIQRVMPSRLDPETTSVFTLFQLLISNLDWSALKGPGTEECCHNVKPIAPRPLQDDDPIIPVPYDFDASGLVNAPYAGPPLGLGVRTVRQRLYRGFCIHNDLLPTTRAKILANETAIMGIIQNDEMLTNNIRNNSLKYLEKYFEMMRDDDDFEKEVVRKCRK
jgi:hypothetical protein